MSGGDDTVASSSGWRGMPGLRRRARHHAPQPQEEGRLVGRIAARLPDPQGLAEWGMDALRQGAARFNDERTATAMPRRDVNYDEPWCICADFWKPYNRHDPMCRHDDMEDLHDLLTEAAQMLSHGPMTAAGVADWLARYRSTLGRAD